MVFLKELAVPITLLIVACIGKFLVKGKWDDEIVFMGPDLVLAGLGGGLAHAIDQLSILLDPVTSVADLHLAGKRIGVWFGYCFAAAVVFGVLLAIHQWAPLFKRFGRLMLQGLLCDSVGAGAMVVVFYLLRRY